MVRLLEQHEGLLRPASLWLGITVPFQGEPCRVGMQSSEVFCCRGSSHGGLLFVVFSAGFEWYIGVFWGMFSLSNFPQTLLAYPQNRLFIFGGTPVCIGAWRHQYCHSNQNSSAGFQPEGRVNHGLNVGVWVRVFVTSLLSLLQLNEGVFVFGLCCFPLSFPLGRYFECCNSLQIHFYFCHFIGRKDALKLCPASEQ